MIVKAVATKCTMDELWLIVIRPIRVYIHLPIPWLKLKANIRMYARWWTRDLVISHCQTSSMFDLTMARPRKHYVAIGDVTDSYCALFWYEIS